MSMEGHMTNRIGRLIAPAALAVSVTIGSASAQTPAQLNPAGRLTELGGSIGAADTASETALMLAGTADWRMTRWLAIEATGGWFARGPGHDAVSADVGALVNLMPKRRTTPYVGLAFGLFRETIDAEATNLPAFYARRIHKDAMSTPGPHTFTDPAWRLSAGVDFIRHRNISVRPEAAVVLVHGNGVTDTLTILTIRLGFAFEDHPVTPSRREQP
jgi:hypothetical protein